MTFANSFFLFDILILWRGLWFGISGDRVLWFGMVTDHYKVENKKKKAEKKKSGKEQKGEEASVKSPLG